MIDPVIHLIISLSFSLLFLLSGVQKLTNRSRFQGIVEAYQVMPKTLVPLIGLKIGVIESVLGVGWLISNSALVPLVSAALLGIYISVISINLYRGRTYIDCGCGFSTFSSRQELDNGIQQLSFSLVIRNYLLIVLALSSVLPITSRVLNTIDYFGVVAGLLTALLTYSALNQLMINNNAIGAWRSANG